MTDTVFGGTVRHVHAGERALDRVAHLAGRGLAVEVRRVGDAGHAGDRVDLLRGSCRGRRRWRRCSGAAPWSSTGPGRNRRRRCTRPRAGRPRSRRTTRRRPHRRSGLSSQRRCANVGETASETTREPRRGGREPVETTRRLPRSGTGSDPVGTGQEISTRQPVSSISRRLRGPGLVGVAVVVRGVALPDRRDAAVDVGDVRAVDLRIARAGRRAAWRRRSTPRSGAAASSTSAGSSRSRPPRAARSRRRAGSTGARGSRRRRP